MDENNEDQRWLEGLAGSGESETPDTPVQTEARLIRKAVLRESQSPKRTFEPTAEGFQRLVDAARRQRLLRTERRTWNPMLGLQKLYEFLAQPASVMASVAIIVGLGIALQLQTIETDTRPGSDTLRSGAEAERVVLRVDEAKAAAEQWQKDLVRAGVEHAVLFEAPNRILIRLRLTPTAIDILQSHRIQSPAGDWCTLVIEPVGAGPK